MSAVRADHFRVDDAAAQHRRVVIDEAHDPVGVVMLVEHLARDGACARTGSDDEHVLLQPARAAYLQEEQPPDHDRHHEEQHRRGEHAMADDEAGKIT